LVSAPPPAWSESLDPVYTIGQVNEANILSGVSQSVLNELEKNAAVKKVGSVIFKNLQFEHHATELPTLTTLFFDRPFIDVFATSELSSEKNGIWLTQRAWDKYFKGKNDEDIHIFHHSRFDIGLTVLGILPASFDYFGNKPIDVYAPNAMYRSLTPFLNDLMIDRFMTAAPIRIGFFSLLQPINTSALQAHLNSNDVSVPQMSFAGRGGEINILKGLVLSPSQQSEINTKYRLLLALLIAFGASLVISIVSLMSNHLIQYDNEYKIEQILGAPFTARLYPMMIFPLTVSICLAVAIPFFYPIFDTSIDRLMLTQTYSAIKTREGFSSIFNIFIWLSLFLFVLGFIVSNKFDTTLFNRAQIGSVSFIKKVGAYTIQYVQIQVALVAIIFVISITTSLLNHSNQYATFKNLTMLKVNTSGIGQVLTNLEHEVLFFQKALAIEPYNTQNTQSIEDSRLPENASVQLFFVSKNFFEQLGIGLGKSEWTDGVVINEALKAMLLDKSESFNPQISIGGLYGDYVINDIIDNQPHAGKTHAPIPAIYLHLSRVPHSNVNQFYILVDPTVAPLVNQQKDLSQWLSKNTTEFNIVSEGSLHSIIDRLDSSALNLMLFGFSVVLAILFSVCFNLYFDAQTRINLEKRDFATLLAIGAPKRDILKSIVKIPFLLLSISMLCILGAVVMSSSMFDHLITQDPNTFLVSLMISSFVIGVLLIASIVFPLTRFLNQPIYHNLK
jgi:ABC-type antimicrobial peptide transport system permease subunit